MATEEGGNDGGGGNGGVGSLDHAALAVELPMGSGDGNGGGGCGCNCSCSCCCVHNGSKLEEIKPHPVLEQFPGVEYCINSPPPSCPSLVIILLHSTSSFVSCFAVN
ncbi:hypothetical protein U1Q18_018888 [Sarracenia purpurea var. burkii]